MTASRRFAFFALSSFGTAQRPRTLSASCRQQLSKFTSLHLQYARELLPGRGLSTAVNTLASASKGMINAEASIPSPIAVIGAGGKMATALITGLLSNENPPRIIASSASRSEMDHLPLPDEDKIDDNEAAVSNAEVVLLSVKPYVAPKVLKQIAPRLSQRAREGKETPIVVSVVAGLSTDAISDLLAEADIDIPVIRTMPNIPAALGAGCTAICGGSKTPKSAVRTAEAVMSSVGKVEQISESLFGAATAVAGSGVAYLFMAAEAMADAGVKHGLDRQTALRMAAATVNGAGALLLQGRHPALLRNDVESPGGVTITATSVLEEEGFRSALGCAIDAAVDMVLEMEEDS